jgi:hypothetical protein
VWADRPSQFRGDLTGKCSAARARLLAVETLRGPTLDDGEWVLEDAVARHDAAPDSFLIPDPTARHSLVIGQGVKLLFWIQSADEGIAVCERMWVLITEILPEGRYVGVLESTPMTPGRLPKGALVQFGPEHVAEIYHGPTGYKGNP